MAHPPTRSPLHWAAYAAEALGLGLFMVSAVVMATVLQHPGSLVHQWLRAHGVTDSAMRVPMGVAMGLTAIAIVYSPFGRRSGAHLNPAVTLTFAWLGKVGWQDLVGYVVAQVIGGAIGLTVTVRLLAGWPADPAVHFVATTPGDAGVFGALAGEAAISGILMGTVLWMAGHPARAPFTGLAAGALVATFIIVEAPLSGMSMNVARSIASNVPAGETASLWIYAIAPPIGMLTAAALHRHRAGGTVGCPRVSRHGRGPCHFCNEVSHD